MLLVMGRASYTMERNFISCFEMGTRMKELLLGAVGLVALSAAGHAADLPLRPATPAVAVFSWTGLYIGGNVGGHWGSDSLTTVSNPVGFPPPTNTNIDALTPVALKPQGVMGGFQIGYNWQVSDFVVGLEGDANWLGGAASRHLVFPFATGQPVPAVGSFMDNATGARFVGTIRPRVGFTIDHLLLYATGGVAFGSVKTTDSFCNNGCAPLVGNFASGGGIATKVGWTAGAGAEWAISNSWSIKAEYLYVNLGSFNDSIPGSANCERFFNAGFGFPSPNCNITTSHKYTDNIARVGVNYHFNPW
jgi:outer membrane immunogenic protein